MIKAADAIRIAREKLGTPYGSGPGEIDCINLIKHVIRTAPGGVKNYTTAGTNALWNSYDMSAKYKDLIWRQESIRGARAGMIAFKRSGDDVHHAGIVTNTGTVIHASSAYGKTVETPLDNTWNLLGVHRYIDTEEAEEMTVYWQGIVATNGGALNLRVGPGTANASRGQIPKGGVVDALWEEPRDGWLYVAYNGMTGYVASQYIQRVETPKDSEEGTQDAPQDNDMVTVTLPRETAKALYSALGYAIS